MNNIISIMSNTATLLKHVFLQKYINCKGVRKPLTIVHCGLTFLSHEYLAGFISESLI